MTTIMIETIFKNWEKDFKSPLVFIVKKLTVANSPAHPILNKIRQRDKINGKCSKCNSKVFCGGCRLTAYGLTGDWLGSDLSCP